VDVGGEQRAEGVSPSSSKRARARRAVRASARRLVAEFADGWDLAVRGVMRGQGWECRGGAPTARAKRSVRG
jgi:hypothetical protein